MIQLSSVIITFNEEQNIERCITSLLPISHEILVVDSFSSDKTEEICVRLGVRFVQHAFEGHIQQKNVAIDLAFNDWILSLDADEVLTEELQKSIQSVISEPTFLGYRLNRLTNYCGHWVRYCGWYPDTKVRLVNRNHARWTGVNPHDRLDMLNNEKTGFLNGDLLHYSYNTKEDHLKQIEYFGKIASNELFMKGKKSNYALITVKVIAQFIKSYLLNKGFLDGKTGFTISRLSAFATYRKYRMLLDLNRQKSKK